MDYTTDFIMLQNGTENISKINFRGVWYLHTPLLYYFKENQLLSAIKDLYPCLLLKYSRSGNRRDTSNEDKDTKDFP